MKKKSKVKKIKKQKIDIVLESLLNLEFQVKELIKRIERLEYFGGKMKFEEFLKKVDLEFSKITNKKIRFGQTVMNQLYNLWPEKYREITGSDYDCFYDDSIVRFTLEKLEKEWNI
jgi:hypothetical protein